MKAVDAAFERARKICLGMPGVEERHSWGFPNFRVGGKMFAALGTGHGGPHLVFKLAEHSVAEDDRFRPVNSIGSWKGFEDWYFYFFDRSRKDDWALLKHLLEVSWELHLAKLPQKKQAAILESPKRTTGSPKRSAPKRRAPKSCTRLTRSVAEAGLRTARRRS